jgi:hypothetical protein
MVAEIMANAKCVLLFFCFRVEQSPDNNKDELDSADDTDGGGKIDNEEVSESESKIRFKTGSKYKCVGSG